MIHAGGGMPDMHARYVVRESLVAGVAWHQHGSFYLHTPGCMQAPLCTSFAITGIASGTEACGAVQRWVPQEREPLSCLMHTD